jgi:serine/threonine-protein kinase HipA
MSNRQYRRSKIGTPAGGARPKAIIAFNERTGQVKSGHAKAPKGFSYWLIKLDGVSDTQFGASTGYGRVEMAYYLMGRDCEIEMTECRYEQLFQTMRLLRLTYPQAEQLFRRMVFNVIARNCDDHTRNFAFRLKKDQQWELAPAYDICHAYRPGSDWVSQHALSVNGKRTNISKDDLLTVASSMNIKKAGQIIIQISEVVKNWYHYAEETKVAEKLRDTIGNTLIRPIKD